MIDDVLPKKNGHPSAPSEMNLLLERAAAQALNEAELFRLMAECSVDALCRFSLDLHCLYASPSATTILGWSFDELIARRAWDLIHPDDVLAARRAHRRNMGEPNEARLSVALRIKKKDGSYVWMEATTRLMRLPDTKPPLQVLASLRDISETRLIAEEQEALTLTDSLTGLGNRRCFDQALVREWRRAVRENTSLTLLMLDVDHFKSFNDRYGHQAGDACLRAIATAVTLGARRPSDAAFRYGGEEMAVLLPSTDAVGAALIAEQIRVTIENLRLSPMGDEERGSPMTTSVGAATMRPQTHGVHSLPTLLLTAADQALYEAKKRGRNRVEAHLPAD